MMLEWLIQAGAEAALTVAMRRRRMLRRAVAGAALLVLAVILGFGLSGQ